MDYQQLLKPFEECKLSDAESKLSLWNKHWKLNPGINSYDLKFYEKTKQKSILHCSCRNGWTDLIYLLNQEPMKKNVGNLICFSWAPD